jgi:hypothetical protein
MQEPQRAINRSLPNAQHDFTPALEHRGPHMIRMRDAASPKVGRVSTSRSPTRRQPVAGPALEPLPCVRELGGHPLLWDVPRNGVCTGTHMRPLRQPK